MLDVSYDLGEGDLKKEAFRGDGGTKVTRIERSVKECKKETRRLFPSSLCRLSRKVYDEVRSSGML